MWIVVELTATGVVPVKSVELDQIAAVALVRKYLDAR
jgi:hypothetical protein